jgi:hypothetical protein
VATFICGHPKSGTSLLLTLLDSHPQLVVYPEESHFFRRFNSEASGLEIEGKKKLAQDLILHIFTWNQDNPPPSQSGFPDRDYSSVNYSRVRDVFSEFLFDLKHEHHHILSSAVLAFGEVSHQLSPITLRWVEKTPYNENFAEGIYSSWPDAKCIHIVRDPRDNFSSYRRKQPDWSPISFARSWRQSTQRGWKNQQRYGDRRYLLIRYEDLVEEPEDIIEEIINFLGIDDDPILRRPTRNGEPWGGNSMFGERFEGVSRSPIGRYKSQLNQDTIAMLEASLFPEMNRLGYGLEHQIDASVRLRWIASRLRWTRQSLHSFLTE